MSDEAFDELLAAWFGNIARVLEPGRGFYIWGGYANCAQLSAGAEGVRALLLQAIIWVKEHPVLTRKDFMGNHEWCFYGWREGAAHQLSRPDQRHRRLAREEGQPAEHGPSDREAGRAGRAGDAVLVAPGENVLDLFGGSGSTLIAAEQTGRQAFLMELDPLYCDVIVQRWEKFTGRQKGRSQQPVQATGEASDEAGDVNAPRLQPVSRPVGDPGLATQRTRPTTKTPRRWRSWGVRAAEPRGDVPTRWRRSGRDRSS